MHIDVVDITQASDAAEIGKLKALGLAPIAFAGMSNGVMQMVVSVISSVKLPGSINVLRIHGHGAPGIMGVTSGTSASVTRSDLASSTTRILGPQLAQLLPYFADGGRVELHGCNTGQGAAGTKLLRDLARTIGVPVSAGIKTQFGGDIKFEGPVKTAMPSGAMISGLP